MDLLFLTSDGGHHIVKPQTLSEMGSEERSSSKLKSWAITWYPLIDTYVPGAASFCPVVVQGGGLIPTVQVWKLRLGEVTCSASGHSWSGLLLGIPSCLSIQGSTPTSCATPGRPFPVSGLSFLLGKTRGVGLTPDPNSL